MQRSGERSAALPYDDQTMQKASESSIVGNAVRAAAEDILKAEMAPGGDLHTEALRNASEAFVAILRAQGFVVDDYLAPALAQACGMMPLTGFFKPLPATADRIVTAGIRNVT